MKIAHVNLASGFGGGERQTLEMMKEQRNAGIDVIAVTNPKGKLSAQVESLGFTNTDASSLFSAHRALNKLHCDVLHADDGRAVHWCCVHKLLFHTPFIATRRVDNPIRNSFLTKFSYAQANVLIGLSDKIVAILQSYCPGKTVKKIPSSPVTYPVSQENIAGIKSRYQGKFLVIHAANLLKHKGFDVTVKAARILERTHPDISIAVLGDGPEKQALLKEASGLSNIVFEGKQSNMGDWFACADLEILPSYNEGLGSVLLEAMKAGVPVIGSDVGGIPDVIDNNVNGILIPAGSPERLAEAIIRLYENSALRQQFVDAANDKLKSFSIQTTAQQYISIYKALLNQS